jgi:hypothetical protein
MQIEKKYCSHIDSQNGGGTENEDGILEGIGYPAILFTGISKRRKEPAL